MSEISQVPRYEEFFARQCLRLALPERYLTLKHSDKPDLVDFSIGLGVEVTSSIPETLRKVDSLYSKYLKENNLECKQKTRNQIERCEAKVSDLGGCVITNWVNTLDVENIYVSKLKKLNSGNYQSLDEYELFIYNDSFMSAEMHKHIGEYFIQESRKHKTIFSRMFLFHQPAYLYIHDMLNPIPRLIKIDERALNSALVVAINES